MGLCEVIKTNVVFADEIFHFTDTRTVDPKLGALAAPFTGTAKICVLEIKDVACTAGHLTGKITFAICEDLKTGGTGGKDLEYFFRLEEPFTFQKPTCPGSDIIALLKSQIKWVKGTVTITLSEDKTTFVQKIDIDVKVILDEEKQLCVALCENSGDLSVVNPT